MFKEPDSKLPLRCDMCEGEDTPKCVEWCLNDVLTYEEREEEVDEDVKVDDVEVGLESMIDKYGREKVLDTIARMSQKEE
jgi:benzoyl-CoA reductase subunit BamC